MDPVSVYVIQTITVLFRQGASHAMQAVHRAQGHLTPNVEAAMPMPLYRETTPVYVMLGSDQTVIMETVSHALGLVLLALGSLMQNARLVFQERIYQEGLLANVCVILVSTTMALHVQVAMHDAQHVTEAR